MRRATPTPAVASQSAYYISIHALLAESDFRPGQTIRGSNNFNPRSPCGERPRAVHLLAGFCQISIHALLAESDYSATATSNSLKVISIHALLAESDPTRATGSSLTRDFNPRSPHGERPMPSGRRWRTGYFNPRSPHGERLATIMYPAPEFQFQSTLSSRRATRLRWFLSRPPHISIHALLTESDEGFGGALSRYGHFNPRSPHGERQRHPCCLLAPLGISIHALLTESDRTERRQLLTRRYFNPRSPHGERQDCGQAITPAMGFQSTLSSRRATHRDHCGGAVQDISIHALLTESDSTSSRSGADISISIHALLTESDEWFLA